MDIKEACVDEISLEGLEGITIPTLWLRLENRQPPVKLCDKIKDYLWGFIVQHDGLGFYRLPRDRAEPQIFDRFGGKDREWIPTARAPDELDTSIEVYSSNPMSDGVTGVRGSCSDYERRADISEEIASAAIPFRDAVAKYGARKLAIVASQSLRESSLLKPDANPRVLEELGDVPYAVLERLGRSRWQGDLQAVLDKKVFTEKSYHIHYVMNKLYRLGLVVKHQYTYRRDDKKGRAFFQVLIHLARFGRDCRSSMTRNIDALRATLESCPNMTMNLGALREHSKANDRHFKTLYNAMQKSGMAVVENIEPGKKPRSIDQKTITLVRKFDEGDDDEDDDMMGMFTSAAEVDISTVVLEKPLMYQCYDYLVQQGESGATQKQMQQFLKGYGRLEARNVCRNLDRQGLTTSILVDRGRQRSQTFIAKNLAQMNSSTREFTDEKNKMKQLLCESSLGVTQGDVSETVGDIADSDVQNSQTADDLILATAQSVSQELGVCDPENNSNESSNECASASSNTPFNPLSCSSPRLNLVDTTHVNSHKKWDANLTTRKIKRHNIILEALHREKVIEGMSTLQKILTKKEEDAGVASRIDRKTVRRLITKMHAGGFLQHHVVPMEQENGAVRDLDMIVSLDCGVKRLRAAIDMAKFKIANEEETKAAQEIKMKKSGKGQRAEKLSEQNVVDYSRLKRIDGNSTVLERYQPKFKRLRIIHQMLYYLTYEHPLLLELLNDDIESDAVAADTVNLDKVHVYQDELTWKRFLPRIPVHFRGSRRWLQLGDVAVVLPIALACQFHRISYEVEGLESWLEDPERRFCLIRHLPPAMRAVLHYKRRLLYSLMTCVEQLAFMGLVTIQKLGSSNPNTMPKENMMLYVHKRATVLDTRSSANAHFKIEEKPYESVRFDFHNSADVDSFWYKLQDVCLKTPIGCHHLQEPDYVGTKDHIGLVALKTFRHEMLERVDDPVDDGRIPGDQRGAGGLDSSMYSYLFRNWSSVSRYKFTPKQQNKRQNKKQTTEDNAIEAQKSIEHIVYPADPGEVSVMRGSSPLNELNDNERSNGPQKKSTSKDTFSEPKIVEVNNVGRNERVKGGRGVKRKKAATLSQEEPVKKKQRAFFRKRRLKSKKITVKRQRLKYTDEKDLAAIMSRKGKCRVSFSHAEDSLMLICHVANTIMVRRFWRHAHDPRRSLVSWLTIRDIMQSILPETHDKTSVSLGRRTRFLMKNQDMRICHDICVTDAMSDRKMIVETLPTLQEFGELGSDQVIVVYRRLVERLRARFQSPPGIFLGEIPDSGAEISNAFNAKIVQLKKERKGPRRQHFQDELRTLRDITVHSLENVIYVALTMGDRDKSIDQAFRAFEHYSNDIFTEVFTSIKRSGWVSSKLEGRRRTSFGVPAHKLSFSHRLSFNTSVPQHAVAEFWDSASTASAKAETKLGIDATFGDVFLACRHFWDATADAHIDIPHQIILPDTRTNSVFENQFLKTMKEVEEEIAGGKLPLPDGSRPSNLVTAAKCLLEQSADAGRDTSDEDDKEEPDGKNDNKLLNLMRMYQRHPSYTNWLLLMGPGKPTAGNEAKFGIHTNYALNSDNVALNPCEINIKNVNVLQAGVSEASILHLFDSKKFKRNESASSWERLLKISPKEQQKLLEEIFEAIVRKGEYGIRIPELYLAVHGKLPTTDDRICGCTQLLIANRVIFTVGVTEKRYVTFEDVLPWLAVGYCFTGARSTFRDKVSHEPNFVERRQRQMPENADPRIVVCEEEKDIEDINGTKKEESAMEVDNAKSPARDSNSLEINGSTKPSVDVNGVVANGTTVDKRAEVLNFGSYNERVQYLCRPWHTISGGVNPKTAKLVFSSVFLRILSQPGITVDKLVSCYDFQPVCILEVVDILCEAGCLTEHSVQAPGPPCLFGRRKKTRIVKYLKPTVDGLTKVALMCNILEKYDKQQESLA